MEFSYDEKQLQTAQNIRESYGERRETDLEKRKQYTRRILELFIQLKNF